MPPLGWWLTAAVLAGIVAYLVWRIRDGRAEVPADALRALDIVWRQLWGMPWDKRPYLYAVPVSHLNCAGGKGWVAIDGRCVAGLSTPTQGGISCTVAFWSGSKPSETALVHELRHARRWLEQPDTQYEADAVAHAAPGFNADIDAANGFLAKAGL